MRREDLLVAASCLVISAVVLVQSVPHYYNDRGSLGSGAYPCYVALLLTICGFSILIQWFRGNREKNAPPFFPTGKGGKLLVCTAASLLLHRIGTDILGFTLASLFLMIYQMRLLGNYRWWTTLAISILFVGLVSYTFKVWLYMDLPGGFIGF